MTGVKAQVLADLIWMMADVNHIGGTPTEMRISQTQKYLEILVKNKSQSGNLKNVFFYYSDQLLAALKDQEGVTGRCTILISESS